MHTWAAHVHIHVLIYTNLHVHTCKYTHTYKHTLPSVHRPICTQEAPENLPERHIHSNLPRSAPLSLSSAELVMELIEVRDCSLGGCNFFSFSVSCFLFKKQFSLHCSHKSFPTPPPNPVEIGAFIPSRLLHRALVLSISLLLIQVLMIQWVRTSVWMRLNENFNRFPS